MAAISSTTGLPTAPALATAATTTSSSSSSSGSSSSTSSRKKVTHVSVECIPYRPGVQTRLPDDLWKTILFMLPPGDYYNLTVTCTELWSLQNHTIQLSPLQKPEKIWQFVFKIWRLDCMGNTLSETRPHLFNYAKEGHSVETYMECLSDDIRAEIPKSSHCHAQYLHLLHYIQNHPYACSRFISQFIARGFHEGARVLSDRIKSRQNIKRMRQEDHSGLLLTEYIEEMLDPLGAELGKNMTTAAFINMVNKTTEDRRSLTEGQIAMLEMASTYSNITVDAFLRFLSESTEPEISAMQIEVNELLLLNSREILHHMSVATIMAACTPAQQLQLNPLFAMLTANEQEHTTMETWFRILALNSDLEDLVLVVKEAACHGEQNVVDLLLRELFRICLDKESIEIAFERLFFNLSAHKAQIPVAIIQQIILAYSKNNPYGDAVGKVLQTHLRMGSDITSVHLLAPYASASHLINAMISLLQHSYHYSDREVSELFVYLYFRCSASKTAQQMLDVGSIYRSMQLPTSKLIWPVIDLMLSYGRHTDNNDFTPFFKWCFEQTSCLSRMITVIAAMNTNPGIPDYIRSLANLRLDELMGQRLRELSSDAGNIGTFQESLDKTRPLMRDKHYIILYNLVAKDPSSTKAALQLIAESWRRYHRGA